MSSICRYRMSVSDMVRVLLHRAVYMSPQVYTRYVYGVNVLHCKYIRNIYRLHYRHSLLPLIRFSEYACVYVPCCGVCAAYTCPGLGPPGIHRCHLSRVVYINNTFTKQTITYRGTSMLFPAKSIGITDALYNVYSRAVSFLAYTHFTDALQKKQ